MVKFKINKKLSRRILICLFPVFVVSLVLLFDMSIIVHQIYSGFYLEEGGVVEEMFEHYSRKFQFDPIIRDISESCIGEDKVSCVFEKINMPYDYERGGGVRTPSEYFRLGGVCRDSAVIRKSALNNLNVDCIFNLSVDNHVFLNCDYKGKSYVLDNGYFSEY